MSYDNYLFESLFKTFRTKWIISSAYNLIFIGQGEFAQNLATVCVDGLHMARFIKINCHICTLT